MASRRRNVIDTHLSQEPTIGHWLWALEDTRSRTMEELENVSQAMVDWLPPNGESSIGTILYHIAVIETDWLYVEVLEQEIPEQVMLIFPYSDRDEQGRLTQVQSIPLADHLKRLETVRGWLMDVFQSMTLDEFRRVRTLEYYDVTPEWVLHHLTQHEAEHRSQIGSLRDRAKRDLQIS